VTFGREWALWLVPAAFLLPLLPRLLLRPPRPEVRFGAMLLLREALAGAGAARRARPVLALLLRCLGAASAAFAFSDPVLDGSSLPFLPAAGRAPSDVVILLDKSYSMRTAFAGGDRFSLAAETAAAALRSLGPGDRAALILFDDEVRGGAEWGAGPEELARLALSARPGWGVTDYRPALEAAFALLSDGSRPEARKKALVLGDGAADGFARMRDGPSALAGYSPSFALAGLDFPEAPANYWAAGVKRAGPGRAPEATVSWNDAARSSPPSHVSLCAPGGTTLPGPRLRRLGEASASAVLSAEPPRGCAAAGPDALSADDRRYYAFGGAASGAGALVLHPGPESPPPGGAAYFLRKYFSSRPSSRGTVFRDHGSLAAAGEGRGPLVLAGLPPFSPAGAAALGRRLSEGGAVIAFVSSSLPQAGELKSYFGLSASGPERGEFRAADWPADALPGFLPSAYESGRVSASSLYRLAPGPYETLLEFAGPGGEKVPALVRVRVGAGLAYVWTAGLDLAWCDLAVKPLFPGFFSALLEAAADDGYGPSGAGAAVGAAGAIRYPRPPPAGGAELRGPSGAVERLRYRAGAFEVPPQDEPGLYSWRAGGESGFYAVNLDHSTGESRLLRAAEAPWTRLPAASAAEAALLFITGVGVRPVFLLLAALLLSAEVLLLGRRP